jgi:uncharacterized iron-regulated protein
MRARLLLFLLACGVALWAAAAAGQERVLDLRSGAAITEEQLLQELRASHFVLLGEVHDNPLHHQRRARLLTRLAPAAVVAEQLERGRSLSVTDDLLADLERAGFQAKGWGWPLHRPLFEALASARIPVQGANLPQELARRIAREGLPAVPADLAAVVQGAALDAVSQARLDADLMEGHCGHLPAARLPGMRLAQRARDAAFFLALRDVPPGNGPAVLVAGNGHVRADYGVPQLIHRLAPDSRTASVGFVEEDASGPLEEAAYRGLHTHLWITSGVPRGDPCAGMRKP